MDPLLIVSIYDKKAGYYGNLMLSPKKGSASRSFGDLISKQGSQYNQHPEDYDLYLLGTYNETSGQIKPQTPEFLINGADFITPTQKIN